MTRNIRLKIVGFTLATLLIGVGHIFADGSSNNNKHRDPSARLQKMTQELNLTEDQQAQIKKIMESMQGQGRGKEMKQKFDEQVMAILNGDQKQKYQEMQAQMKAKWSGKHRNSGTGQNN